jgi:hypothetical protein
VKNINFNLKSAGGHILYAQIRTIRWLIKVLTWGVLVCFSVSLSIRRAIVWMPSDWVVMYRSNYLYALVSESCESMTVQPSV